MSTFYGQRRLDDGIELAPMAWKRFLLDIKSFVADTHRQIIHKLDQGLSNVAFDNVIKDLKGQLVHFTPLPLNFNCLLVYYYFAPLFNNTAIIQFTDIDILLGAPIQTQIVVETNLSAALSFLKDFIRSE